MVVAKAQPVDAPLLLACVQLGQGNCKTMVQAGQCSGFSDANGTTICKVTAGMRNALNGLPAGGGVTAGSGGDVGTGSVAVNGGGAHVRSG